MLEVYSNNVTGGANASIPLNNVSVLKGATATKNGDTISLNACGVYEAIVSGSVTVPTGTTVTVQLEVNGILQPQSQATITGTADNVIPFSFPALIPVRFNNTPNPCTTPTVVRLVGSAEATYPIVKVSVTKIV